MADNPNDADNELDNQSLVDTRWLTTMQRSAEPSRAHRQLLAQLAGGDVELISAVVNHEGQSTDKLAASLRQDAEIVRSRLDTLLSRLGLRQEQLTTLWRQVSQEYRPPVEPGNAKQRMRPASHPIERRRIFLSSLTAEEIELIQTLAQPGRQASKRLASEFGVTDDVARQRIARLLKRLNMSREQLLMLWQQICADHRWSDQGQITLLRVTEAAFHETVTGFWQVPRKADGIPAVQLLRSDEQAQTRADARALLFDPVLWTASSLVARGLVRSEGAAAAIGEYACAFQGAWSSIAPSQEHRRTAAAERLARSSIRFDSAYNYGVMPPDVVAGGRLVLRAIEGFELLPVHPDEASLLSEEGRSVFDYQRQQWKPLKNLVSQRIWPGFFQCWVKLTRSDILMREKEAVVADLAKFCKARPAKQMSARVVRCPLTGALIEAICVLASTPGFVSANPAMAERLRAALLPLWWQIAEGRLAVLASEQINLSGSLGWLASRAAGVYATRAMCIEEPPRAARGVTEALQLYPAEVNDLYMGDDQQLSASLGLSVRQ